MTMAEAHLWEGEFLMNVVDFWTGSSQCINELMFRKSTTFTGIPGCRVAGPRTSDAGVNRWPCPSLAASAIMGRPPEIERPYEPIPTSHGTRAKAGATHPAGGDHWEP